MEAHPEHIALVHHQLTSDAYATLVDNRHLSQVVPVNFAIHHFYATRGQVDFAVLVRSRLSTHHQ